MLRYWLIISILLISSVVANASDRLVQTGMFGLKGEGYGGLNYARDIALDKEGNLYTVDYSNHKIIKFSPEGEFLMEFGKFGSDPGRISWPAKITVDKAGNIFVLDRHDMDYISSPRGDRRDYYRVQKFSPKGKYLWSVGKPGKGKGQFDGLPADIDCDASGNLYVLDRGNYRVQVFNRRGRFVRMFGSYGEGEGEFDYPSHLLVDKRDGSIFVADTYNYRIQKFDNKGNFLLAFGKQGYNNGEFKYPYPSKLYFDRNYNLCAVSSFTFTTSGKRRYIKYLLQKFDTNGRFLHRSYAVERYYDNDDTYYMTYLDGDSWDQLYLFHSRDKTINRYRLQFAAVNIPSMTKNYYLEVKQISDGYNYNYLSTTSTRENTRLITGLNPEQIVNISYDHDDRTTVTLNNTLSYSYLTGLRDDKTVSTTTTWSSWEATKDSLYNNTYLQIRYTYDKTKNKDLTYKAGYNYNAYKTRWTTKAPNEEQPYAYDSMYTNLNYDLGDFSDLEIGYSNRTTLSGYDSDFSNYNYQYLYPYSYIYLKYHADF